MQKQFVLSWLWPVAQCSAHSQMTKGGKTPGHHGRCVSYCECVWERDKETHADEMGSRNLSLYCIYFGLLEIVFVCNEFETVNAFRTSLAHIQRNCMFVWLGETPSWFSVALESSPSDGSWCQNPGLESTLRSVVWVTQQKHFLSAALNLSALFDFIFASYKSAY